jgi:hypothetical protein
MSTYKESATGDSNVAEPTIEQQNIFATDQQSTVLDAAWAKQAFFVSAGDLESVDVLNRTFSTVSLSFQDTSLGGTYAVNSRPQFTRYADLRSMGRLPGRELVTPGSITGKNGMGRYYHEAIDKNKQQIHMRFGVPQYNSLTQFFTGYYNSKAAALSRSGRTTLSEKLGYAVGRVISLVASVAVWQLAAVNALGHVASFFFGKQTSKYYYLKPTMLSYWSAVNSIVNKIAVGRGLIPSLLKSDDPTDQKIDTAYLADREFLEQLHDLMPEVFSKDGGIDVYAVANRAQRFKIAADNELWEQFNNSSSTDFAGVVQKAGQEMLSDSSMNRGWYDRLQSWLKSEATMPDPDSKKADLSSEQDIKIDPDYVAPPETPGVQQNDPTRNRSWLKNFWADLKAELDDGAAFATFEVEYTGSVQESFSNSVRDSDIQGKMNGMASSGRSVNFSFAGGGNIGGIGSVIDMGVNTAKGIIAGTADTFGLSGLLQLAGGGFVDIPKHWESSSASLPRSSYTIKLRSPYGNVISQMQNLYIPLSMLLAAALPLSTGKQSYTSPFICELYDHGRHQTRLGMIDSLSITRGTTNLGFNSSNQAMGIDVSFTVVDMSSVMHMQISRGFFGHEDGVFDEETVFSDYMNTLSSLSLDQQFHTIPKLRLNAARKLRSGQAFTSPAAWALWVKEDTPVGMLEGLFAGTRR